MRTNIAVVAIKKKKTNSTDSINNNNNNSNNNNNNKNGPANQDAAPISTRRRVYLEYTARQRVHTKPDRVAVVSGLVD